MQRLRNCFPSLRVGVLEKERERKDIPSQSVLWCGGQILSNASLTPCTVFCYTHTHSHSRHQTCVSTDHPRFLFLKEQQKITKLTIVPRSRMLNSWSWHILHKISIFSLCVTSFFLSFSLCVYLQEKWCVSLPTTSSIVSVGLCIGKTVNTPSTTRTCCSEAAYCVTQRAAMASLYSQVCVSVCVNVCVIIFRFNLS